MLKNLCFQHCCGEACCPPGCVLSPLVRSSWHANYVSDSLDNCQQVHGPHSHTTGCALMARMPSLQGRSKQPILSRPLILAWAYF